MKDIPILHKKMIKLGDGYHFRIPAQYISNGLVNVGDKINVRIMEKSVLIVILNDLLVRTSGKSFYFSIPTAEIKDGNLYKDYHYDLFITPISTGTPDY